MIGRTAGERSAGRYAAIHCLLTDLPDGQYKNQVNVLVSSFPLANNQPFATDTIATLKAYIQLALGRQFY